MYFLQLHNFNDLDLPPWNLFPYRKLYILGTNIEAQCNCIFFESWFLVILMCPSGIRSYGNLYSLVTNTVPQCNCIFCESRFLIILICLVEFYFHMETVTCWIQIIYFIALRKVWAGPWRSLKADPSGGRTASSWQIKTKL